MLMSEMLEVEVVQVDLISEDILPLKWIFN